MRTLLALVLLGLTAFIGTVIAIGLGVNPMVVGVVGRGVRCSRRRQTEAEAKGTGVSSGQTLATTNHLETPSAARSQRATKRSITPGRLRSPE